MALNFLSMQKVMTEWYDFPNVNFTKILSLFSVVDAYGLIYPRLLGENSSFAHSSFRPGFTQPGQDFPEPLARLACDRPSRVFIGDFISAFIWHMKVHFPGMV